MASISGKNTKALLVRANELARDLEKIEVDLDWQAHLDVLTDDKCPRTYLAVTCILLTARAMHPKSELNVLEIKRGENESDSGYSAPSIGSVLAAFAKEHLIDLRATSQQPMNNQPFTYKDSITQDMSVKPSVQVFWNSFFEIASFINDLPGDRALHYLAFVFSRRKKVKTQAKEYATGHIDWAFIERAKELISTFIDSKSDSGKVGQAFASAMLDVLYSEDFVDQGNSQDPDASTPGDVHVRDLTGEIWLWVEVKQQPIQTGQVIGFIEKVAANNGERILYLALRNSNYPSEIARQKVDLAATKNDIRITVFQSPEETIDWFLEYAPGTYGQVMSTVLSRLHARLTESGCSAATLTEFETLSDSLTS